MPSQQIPTPRPQAVPLPTLTPRRILTPSPRAPLVLRPRQSRLRATPTLFGPTSTLPRTAERFWAMEKVSKGWQIVSTHVCCCGPTLSLFILRSMRYCSRSDGLHTSTYSLSQYIYIRSHPIAFYLFTSLFFPINLQGSQSGRIRSTIPSRKAKARGLPYFRGHQVLVKLQPRP